MTDATEDGFTLVEVLVAFVILTGAIILSFQIFADGLHRLSTVEARIKSVDIARSELAKLSAAGNITEGVTTGTTDGVAWEITVHPIDGLIVNTTTSLRPYKIEVRIIDKSEGTADTPVLETILLGRSSQP